MASSRPRLGPGGQSALLGRPPRTPLTSVQPHLAHAGRRRVLAEEAGADDLLVDRRLADVALPLAPVARERAAAAVHVLRRVDGRLDRALPVAAPRARAAASRTQWYSTSCRDDRAVGLGARERERAGGQALPRPRRSRSAGRREREAGHAPRRRPRATRAEAPRPRRRRRARRSAAAARSSASPRPVELVSEFVHRVPPSRCETEPERPEPAVDAHARGARSGAERVARPPRRRGRRRCAARSPRAGPRASSVEGFVQTVEPRLVGLGGRGRRGRGGRAGRAACTPSARSRPRSDRRETGRAARCAKSHGPAEPPASSRNARARATPARTSRPSGRARPRGRASRRRWKPCTRSA